MAQDPAFLFYSSDFLTGVSLLNYDQIGKYIKLLCLTHQMGRLSESDMLKICGTYDSDVFSKFTKDESGLYYNNRLEKEVEKRKKYSESRRENRSKSTSKDKPVKENKMSKSYVRHMENENENILSNNTHVEGVKGETQKLSEIVWVELDSKMSDEAKSVWTTLCETKKWKGKTKQAITLSLKKLLKYEELFAISLMQSAIEMEYQGVVYANTDADYKKWKSTPRASPKKNTDGINPKSHYWNYEEYVAHCMKLNVTPKTEAEWT